MTTAILQLYPFLCGFLCRFFGRPTQVPFDLLWSGLLLATLDLRNPPLQFAAFFILGFWLVMLGRRSGVLFTSRLFAFALQIFAFLGMVFCWPPALVNRLFTLGIFGLVGIFPFNFCDRPQPESLVDLIDDFWRRSSYVLLLFFGFTCRLDLNFLGTLLLLTLLFEGLQNHNENYLLRLLSGFARINLWLLLLLSVLMTNQLLLTVGSVWLVAFFLLLFGLLFPFRHDRAGGWTVVGLRGLYHQVPLRSILFLYAIFGLALCPLGATFPLLCRCLEVFARGHDDGSLLLLLLLLILGTFAATKVLINVFLRADSVGKNRPAPMTFFQRSGALLTLVMLIYGMIQLYFYHG